MSKPDMKTDPKIDPKTDYEKYLKTDALLSLQKEKSQMICHDELQFQVVHQVSELWMKLFEHEFNEIIDRLNKKNLIGAHVLFERAKILLQMMTAQLSILNTMSPYDYHLIRTQLGKGSGQESPGFNRILENAPKLWPVFEKLMLQDDETVLSLHENPTKNQALFLIAEDLFSIDELFIRFRFEHLQLVKRIIGGDVPSLKGVHAEKYLTLGIHESFYPLLWKVRNELSQKRGLPAYGESSSELSGACPYSRRK